MEFIPTYLPNIEAAKNLGQSSRTLEKFRVTGARPEFFKFGRRVLYSREDLETWAFKRKRGSISDNCRPFN
jgi:hypothetical protein